MRVSIVIPAFNNWALTERCVATIRRTTPADLIADIIIVDDASTDGVTRAWTAAQPGITPVLLERNRGFSGACNAGAGACTGDAILFLNNDAFARPSALEIMRATLASEPQIGVVGARLLYSDGTLQHAGLALLPGSVSRWWHIHRRRDGTLPDANVARDLLAVTGAALLIRRELFAELGGFDDGFINGWEDVDLCLRAWCAGARVRYEPRAVLEHLESATLGRSHNHERNERRFVERWHRALDGAPRYELAEVPPISLAAGRSADLDAEDRFALAHVRRWWKAHVGAAVLRTRPGSVLDRARVDFAAAVARRLPTLEVSWNNAVLTAPTGSRRVAFVAPGSAADARRYVRAPNVAQWWTPTDTARGHLISAGCATDDVIVARLGAQTLEPPARDGRAVVGAVEDDRDLVAAVRANVPDIECVLWPRGGAPVFGRIDVVLARGDGDRWGLTVPAAIGHGCAVVCVAPIDSLSAQAAGIRAVPPGDVVATASKLVTQIARLRAGAPERYLDARRRLDAYLATQHISELARAITGGESSTAGVEVTPAYAAVLRATTVDPREFVR